MTDFDPTPVPYRPLPPISKLVTKPFPRLVASADPVKVGSAAQSSVLPVISSQNRSAEERETAWRIKWLRNTNDDLPAALEACLDAVNRFPQNSFFSILAVDLLIASSKPAEAATWLIEALRRWESDNAHFAKFAKNFHRLEWQLAHEEALQLRSKLIETGQARPIGDPIRRECERLLGMPEKALETTWSATANNLAQSLDQGRSLQVVVPLAKKLVDEKGQGELEAVLDRHLLSRERRNNDVSVDEHFLAAYEEMGQIGKAFQVAESLLRFDARPIFAATFLRLCRKLEDYSAAEQLLKRHPELLQSRLFNLLYELVYYYEANNDLEKAGSILSRIEKQFADSQPIQTTVRNFYLKFGMLNDAQRLDARLARPGRAEFASKAEEVGAETHDYLFHQQQLAALTELTRGISHELGQPITNVRYTVQFYLEEFKREMRPEKVLQVFDVILRQTERMGDLVKRLSPLTSSHRVIAQFDAVERMKRNIDALQPRFEVHRINVQFLSKKPVFIEGDAGHFDQLASNLLLNAIDALVEHRPDGGGRIKVDLREIGQSLRVTIEDNGPGIPMTDRRRIFNPFYTTKPPGKGEGLGLFIVWNMLKMQGGTVSLDSSYQDGARFLVTMRKAPLPTEQNE